MKARVQLTAGIVSLIALLFYTLAHTGALLSQYVTPGWIGYAAALGIELSIVSLSLRIGDLRKSQQATGFFFFVLVSVVVVSAIANVSEGFLTMYGEQLTMSTVQKLDPVQSLIGITSTGLISLIVLALAEIVGSDVTSTAKAAEKERNKKASLSTGVTPEIVTPETETANIEATPESETTGIEATPEQAEKARQAKVVQDAETKTERMGAILAQLGVNPQMGVKELATLVNASRQTVYRDLDELQQAGRLHKNGNGWVTL